MSTVIKRVMNKALTDVKFGKEIFNQLPLNVFEDDNTKELAQIINRYYITNNKPLSQEGLLTLVETRLEKKNADDEKINSMISSANNAYDLPLDTNEEIIEESIRKFVARALSIDLLSKTLAEHSIEDKGVIETLSDKLREIAVLDTKGKSDGSSVDFFNDRETKLALYKDMRSITHPTGFANLDRILDGGGIGRGEVALLIAPTGTGKTTFSIQVAANAVKQKLNVLYITLEEKAARINYRLETNILGINSSWMMKGNEIDEERFNQTQDFYEQNRAAFGNLYVEKRMPREVSIHDLEQIIIDWKIRKGNDVDVVIIDYPALMKVDTRNNDYPEGELFERIRGIAQKYNFICWTLAQTNRSAFGLANGGGTVTSANIEGSKKVLNHVELCLSLNRSSDEYENNKLRLYVDKSRNPQDGTQTPEFLYFKMDPIGYQIIAETASEEAEHKQLLNSAYSESAPKANSFDRALESVSSINDSFNKFNQG